MNGQNYPNLKALSLFSGAGGMDLGVRKAGFDILASIEIDKHCCDTLLANKAHYGDHHKILNEDVSKIKPTTLMKSLSLKPRELDLIIGGPPCQSFSQIGKQLSLKDKRGPLIFELHRFAKIFLPNFVMIEQVKGLLTAKGPTGVSGGVMEKIINQFSEIGYEVKWRLLNAADYGVPQLRKRVFLIFSRTKNHFHDFPEVTHAPLAKTNGTLFPVSPYVTVGECLRGIKAPSGGKSNIPKNSHVDITPERDKERIEHVPEGGHLAAQLHLPKEVRGNLTKKDTTKFLRLSRNRPSNTLRCGEIFFHPTKNRYLTPREYMRIHSYPDNYFLTGPVRGRTGVVKNLDQHRQVANSVPPLIACLLANEMVSSLRDELRTV